ncbi:aminotransferase class V-fold PLP-dependent enzyme [Rubripirellula reticaptiva]|uniref:cysteine desulfurase n=1 Tax=Rubripirellula reticaptiva TaxID=2528013 RepID=A0A5C6ELV1_9BACT|nr:aminotransferase class V-fold PLP-dependent enzyme [Rubripirellula reticaptiva]TWU49107.1 putative cysteine desulfurase [Rubripirellula reticaptiva]
MSQRKRIYMDHAATSWPKPDIVLDAMDSFARHCGATAGRGGYDSAVASSNIIASARHTLGTIIGAPSDDCVSLQPSGTAALNAAIHGVLRPGDHVVTTAAEHNSVLRPLHHWQRNHNVRLTIVPTDSGGRVDADELIAAVADQTRLVTLTSASNVTGAIQPVEAVGKRLANHSAIFLCDAAQSFGTIAINAAHCCIDMLAAPGHKSSGGPAGTGFLYVAPRIHDQIVPMIQGGTGSQSESLEMPSSMPTMLEAGNLNVPAIAGWLETLKALSPDELANRTLHAAKTASLLHRSLRKISGITLHANSSDLPIASITSPDYSASDLSMILDSEFAIETRAGLHCAALIHDCIGTSPEGTLRISAGHTTTTQEIESVVAAIQQIVQPAAQ